MIQGKNILNGKNVTGQEKTEDKNIQKSSGEKCFSGERKWWKEAIVYQIYPRSFKDSNDDGIGDLKGIISRLDYLQELGINVVWLSPVYKSPNDDNGYDVSDYCDIMDEFGTLEDWEQLRDGLHKRGIRLIMDLVVNHTSDEHQWFIESRSSVDSPYRDYYFWRDGKNGREPNNWCSAFGGSAWEYDENTKQYYLHIFSKKQVDLRWDNPKVRQDVYKMMKWWLDKGVDGFRMDVINYTSKVDELPDVKTDEPGYHWGGEYFVNGPRVHEYLQEMNREVLSKYDIMTVGETPNVTLEDAKLFTDEDRKELNMVFQFEIMDLDVGPEGKWQTVPWTLPEFKRIITKWQKGLGNGWNSIFFGSHDAPRMVSRFGNDGIYRVESAKMLATLLLTLKGTPYIYQGDEIGMTNVRFPVIDDYRDIEILNMYREAVYERNLPVDQVMQAIHLKGRDNARTPMQWDDSKHGGFTKGEPWIKVNPNYKTINVKEAMKDPESILHYYKRLIKLRKDTLAFVYGDYDIIDEDNGDIFAYKRTYGNEKYIVVLNFSDKNIKYTLPEKISCSEFVEGNYKVDDKGTDLLELRPYEARIYKIL
ncbi:MAG: alpha-glucosidase [Clostridiaceae bacterium]|nr:alpha-glucosidase [Clostridiaceae bacterium]